MLLLWRNNKKRSKNIVAYNQETADLIQKDLGIQFHNMRGRTDTLESRKELVKIMREKYKKNLY